MSPPPALLPAWLSSGQLSSASPTGLQAGPSRLPLCDTVGADGVPLCDTAATSLGWLSPPRLMPELGCLGLEVDVGSGCVPGLCFLPPLWI